MIDQLPNARLAVRWNRAFLRRVVRYLVGQAGIRQIVDIGARLETVEPGLVWPPEWRPDPGDVIPANAAESYYCVLVARKP
jgi:hypothetical protein